MTTDIMHSLRATALSHLPAIVQGAQVDAIAFQGGLGRGHVDALSDIDILLGFKSMSDATGALKGELDIAGVKWSVFHLYYDKVDPTRWKDKLRFIYSSETLIVEDKSGHLRTLCDAAHLSNEEQIERVIYAIKKLGNRGVTYQGITKADWRGIFWGDPVDLWITRGDLYAAHARLTQAHELIINLLFALNQLPVPSSKWLHHLVGRLPWVPSNFDSQIQDLMIIREIDAQDVLRRAQTAISLVTQCIDEALQRGLLPDDIGAFYFPRFSKHTDNTDD